MRARCLIAICVLSATCAGTIAQTAATPHVETPAPRHPAPDSRDISALLSPIIKKHDVPGMVAGIVVGDRLVAAGAAGVRKRGSPETVTLDDQFHIGSCTKAMTATMCAILVDQGTLRWDMTLAEAFPDLADRMHADFRPVTLAQLLTNRGGVPADLSTDGLWGKLWKAEGGPVAARRMLLEGVVTHAPEYSPGTKNIYANASFAIAGHVAETVTGKPYEVLMQELLFTPLGMSSCGWGAPGTPGIVDQPWGHDRDGKPVNPLPNTPDGRGSDNPPAITPAGRLHCSLADWSRFIALHLRGDSTMPYPDARLLTSATLHQLHVPPDSLSDYAFGWSRPIRPWAKGDAPGATGHVLTHGGSNTMWFCVTWIAPERDFAVLIMCNQAERGDKACDEAAWALIQDHLKSTK